MKALTFFCLLLFFFCLGASAASLPKGAESKFAQVNGIKMHYVIMGKGPLVVLLHGWPQTWYEWRKVMPILATHFTVVAPDLRGLGLSEKTSTGYDKKRVAEDIAALIKQLGEKSAIVVGHDMGGKVGYVLGLLHPELVSKLVLVDCMPPGTENMDPAKGGMWHYGFHMAPEFPEMLTKGREREYIAAQMTQLARKKASITQEAIDEYAKHYSSRGGMTAGFNYYRTLLEDAKFLTTFGDKQFAMPILTIAGRFGVSENLYKAMSKKSEDVTGIIVEDSEATEDILNAIQAKHPLLYGIVNNVGLSLPQPLGEIQLVDLHKALDLNIRTAIQVVQKFVGEMKTAAEGRIINIASRAIFGLPHRSSYAAAKGGLVSMSKVWALELAPFQITVNAIAPGPIETEMFRKNFPMGSKEETKVLAQIPLGRVGQPQEIACTIRFLMSQEAGFMTGQLLCVDGGGSL